MTATSANTELGVTGAVLAARVVLGTAAFVAIVFSDALHPYMEVLWSWLLQRSFFQASYFETLWTVGLYTFFEWYYVSLAASGESRPPLPKRIDQRAGKSHLWRNGTVRVRKLRGRLRELIIYVAPLLCLDLVLIKKFKGVAWEDMVASGGYDPSALQASATGPLQQSASQAKNHYTSALPANIRNSHFLAPSTHNFTLQSPLQLSRALPSLAPSPRRVVLELVASVLLYDLLFFFVHLALHKVPSLYDHLHATHHDHAEIHAQVTNQLDLGERLMLVLTANFALQIIGAHVLTRALFVPVFVLFLVQNHCGLDVLSYDKILPSSWGAGPKVHAQHHRLGTTGFAPFFQWCDALYERCTGSHERLMKQREKDDHRIANLLEKKEANCTVAR